MKHKHTIILVLSFVLTIFTFLSCENNAVDPEAEEIEFKDKGLERTIRESINKYDGPLTRSDLKKISLISVRNVRIENLDGIEYCTNLSSLTIQEGWIVDLSPIAKLENLHSLDLRYNKITDISPIYGLTKLSWLDISYNNIYNVDSLNKLINLEYLYMSNNYLTVIPALKLEHIKRVVVDHNYLKDLRRFLYLKKPDMISAKYNSIYDLNDLFNAWFLDPNGRVDIYLKGNPINQSSMENAVPELETYGIRFFWD